MKQKTLKFFSYFLVTVLVVTVAFPLSVFGGVTVSADTGAISATESIKAAANQNSATAGTGDAMVTPDGQWKLQYQTRQSGGWKDMELNAINSDIYYFAMDGTGMAQPSAIVQRREGNGEYYVDINANQYASANWWSKAGVAFTAAEAGDYVISCSAILPGRVYNSSIQSFINTLDGENGDGHVIVTKNGVKIWPTDTDYASVTAESNPSVSNLLVSLAQGDIIRFEGFGGQIGQNTPTVNPNGYMNTISMQPTIAKATGTKVNTVPLDISVGNTGTQIDAPGTWTAVADGEDVVLAPNALGWESEVQIYTGISGGVIGDFELSLDMYIASPDSWADGAAVVIRDDYQIGLMQTAYAIYTDRD